MNKRTENQFRQEWIIAHSVYERQIFRFFKNALDSQVKSVVDELKNNGLIGLSTFLPIIIQNDPIIEAYRKSYELVSVRFGKWTTDWITDLEDNKKSRFGKKLLDFGSEFWREQIRSFLQVYGAEKVAELNATTVDRIRTVLTNAQTQNLTISEQATLIVDTLSSPDYNRSRALRIARTETTMAANEVSLTAGKNARYRVRKTWIAVEDNRTRPAHSAVNGTSIELNEMFNVGGEMMERPGDPNASVGQLANCRCVLAIEPVLDEDGLPIPI